MTRTVRISGEKAKNAGNSMKIAGSHQRFSQENAALDAAINIGIHHPAIFTDGIVRSGAGQWKVADDESIIVARMLASDGRVLGMIEDWVIRVLADWENDQIEGRVEGRIIRLMLDIFGDRETLTISVKDEPARLADIVPLARVVSAKITDKACEKARLNGATIPCGKGCSACCNYLVPLAVPEVFRLRQEIGEMPLVRRLLIEQECVKAAQQILGERPPASFAEIAAADTAESTAQLLCTASDWYSDFQLSCPFLYKRMCTIYETRPMACREHSVTGCAQACGGGQGEANGMFVPARMSEVLGRLASEMEGAGVEGLIMPLALIWADDNPQRDAHSWPASEMVERFFEIVCEELPGSSVQTVVPAHVR